MHDYLITPKAPLLFRDGKPFGADDNSADTLLFPQPSTIAGVMRTAWAEANHKKYDEADDIESIKKKRMLGPLLASISSSDQVPDVLFPTPADSLCLNKNGESIIYRLVPNILGDNEGTDLPAKLTPVFPLEDDADKLKGKPAKDSPKFWSSQSMQAWLLDDSSDQLPANEQGVQNLPIETRTHVSIEPKTQTAREGHLFQTAGLDFSEQRSVSAVTANDNVKSWGWEEHEFALACQFQETFDASYRTIGGESRLGRIQQKTKLFPTCPPELGQTINQTKAFRLILATPAIFTKGYIPEFIDENTLQGQCNGMTLKLHAVAIPRWQAGTSWNMAAKEEKHNSKKGTGMCSLKRLAPAGSVYWFELLEPDYMQVDSFWLSSISDERANDGYGLTTIGVWNMPESLSKPI
jgi:CRISPR-associated protein Cmr3